MKQYQLRLMQLRHYIIPKGIWAVILNLILKRADKRQWQLNIGTYLLKKGVGWEIGHVISKEPLSGNQMKVSYISGLFYFFAKNKVIHNTGVKIVNSKK